MKRESRALTTPSTHPGGGGSAVALVSRMAEGDGDAVAELHGLARRHVYGHCRKILRDRADAEEVTMDVFVQAWQQATRFDASRGQPKTWLLTMARSRSLDRLRSDGRSKRLEDGLEAAAELISPAADPEAGLALAERARLVRGALRHLKSNQRRAIELTFLEGLTGVEAAARLAAPLGTIKSWIRAGLRDLRKTLSPTFDGPGLGHA